MEAAVDRAFDSIEDGASVANAREQAKAFPMSCILIGADHSVLAYTGRLMGLDDTHSEFLGKDCRESLAVATYTDKSRANTLADKVAENPHDADETWDIERTDGESQLVDFPVYRDTSITNTEDGLDTHIEFVAVPIFDENGDT